MSFSNEVLKPELVPTDDSSGNDIQKQRWFHTCQLSKSRVEVMLCNEQSNGDQASTSKFIVSKLSSKDYRMSIRKTGQAVEHIIISYNEEDQSYGIEGQNSCQSVVEVVRNYVTSCGYALEPFSGSFEITSTEARTEPTQMEELLATQKDELPASASTLHSPIDKQPVPQIRTELDPLQQETNCKPSTESTQMEELPAYAATMQYPTDIRSLPQVGIKLDPLQEAKLKGSFQENTSSSVPRFDGGESGCCCEVSCDSLCDELGFEDAGCLQSICLGILYIIVVVCCGCCLLILSVTLNRCSDQGIYDKCCDCCPRCCGCEEFCEEHNSCCDVD